MCRSSAGLTILLALLILAACAPKSAQQTVFRIGIGPWVGFGPLYLAQEKNFFAKRGVRVDLIVLAGLAERNSALQSRAIDALAAPVDYFVLSAGNHIPTQIVMALDESNGGDGIAAKPGIRTFEDLRGKRVAYQRGLPSDFFLRALLEQHGMTLDDLRAVDMETADAGAAFISNRLDAAGLWEPWLTKAVQEGHGHLLASTREYPNLIVDCLAFNPSAYSQHVAGIQKIVDATLEAVDYWKQHSDEADGIMAPHFQVNSQQYANILKGAKLCDLATNRDYFGTNGKGPIFDVAARASRIWIRAQVMKTPVDPNSIITTNFIQGVHE
jgi:NitT/TauT family transport system substrate-binding protein